MDGLTTSGFVPRVALFSRTGTVEGIVSSASAVDSRSTLIFKCARLSLPQLLGLLEHSRVHRATSPAATTRAQTWRRSLKASSDGKCRSLRLMGALRKCASSCEGNPVYATSIGWERASMRCHLILKDLQVFSPHVHSKVLRPV